MKTYYAIYDKVLSTDSKRFNCVDAAVKYFTNKLWKHQVFTLIELSFFNGIKYPSSTRYKIYNGISEIIK